MAYTGVLRWGAGVGFSAAVGRLGVFVWEAVAVAEREGSNVTESLFEFRPQWDCAACGYALRVTVRSSVDAAVEIRCPNCKGEMFPDDPLGQIEREMS